jgi:hypothetical protein
MDMNIIELDGSKYPYKSKKKRIYKKWVKKHIVKSVKLTNVVPNKVDMHQDENGAMTISVGMNYTK